jgi:hypothetical protein
MWDEWGFIAAAYGVTWGTLLAYWGYVMLRGRRARRALAEALGSQAEEAG